MRILYLQVDTQYYILVTGAFFFVRKSFFNGGWVFFWDFNFKKFWKFNRLSWIVSWSILIILFKLN